MDNQCIVCNNTFKSKRVAKFCSDKCRQRNRPKEDTNTYAKQEIKGRSRKLELIALKGGECEICGYNTNLAALSFHHLNPSIKEFKLDFRNLSNRSMTNIMEEFNKCQLLCANCHMEVHNPGLNIN